MVGKQVQVYRNLHKDCYSIRDKKTRRVVGYATSVILQDVTFKVSEAGRQRVLREQRKNVHAVVEGTLTHADAAFLPESLLDATRVRYNPYHNETFVGPGDKPILTAGTVTLTSDFKMFAWEVGL